MYRRIVNLVEEAFQLARSVGIQNLLQPGLVKEMVIADILGHEIITSKREPDARDPENPEIKYEYLTCKEGGSGQFDRMFNRPHSRREQSLDRIRRNSKIYLAVFYADNQIKVKAIYELDTNDVEAETIRQLDRSRNEISHVGFSVRWARDNGLIVYDDTKRQLN